MTEPVNESYAGTYRRLLRYVAPFWPVFLVAVFASFAVMCAMFEWSRRLSAPMIIHLIVNVVR